MTKSIEQKYQVLSDIDHVLKRPGRYVGSITPLTGESYTIEDDKIVFQENTFNPAFLKIFDEIVSNSVDFSKTPEGKHVDTVRVDICPLTHTISVFDNGGIPVVMHKEAGCYVPEMIFGQLRAGSNFDDNEDSFSTGQNGEGAVLCNILSEVFIVETADGKNSYKQTFSGNMRSKEEPKIKKSSLRFTRITYKPDYEFFKTDHEAEFHKLAKRVYDIAACNPKLKVYLNEKLIKFGSFEDYIKLYSSDYVYTNNKDWRIGVTASDRGFQHISFVNSTETYVGGTHIDYISNQIVKELREWIKKKKKVDVKPADIRNHLTLFIDCNIVNPRYSSQTKENLITDPKDYKTSITLDEKFIAKVIKSPVVEKIMDWVDAKARQQELAELRKLNKDANKGTLKKIVKFEDSSERIQRTKCSIFFAEGDSAAKPLTAGRDPKLMGVFPLKGKPLNVRGIGVAKMKKNEELQNIMAILGLQFGKKASMAELRFGKIVIAADQDLDGHHITGLMLNMFNEFWPELLQQGLVYRLNTPIIKATVGKKSFEFFTLPEFKNWEAQQKGSYSSKYYKGLGSWSTAEIRNFMQDSKYLLQLKASDAEDIAALDLAFDKTKSDDRKAWLIGEVE